MIESKDQGEEGIAVGRQDISAVKSMLRDKTQMWRTVKRIIIYCFFSSSLGLSDKGT